MFNLTKEVQKLQQLKHDKVHGLPHRKKQHSPKVVHMDGTVHNGEAVQEGDAISRGFRNKSLDFGRRLSKTKGQRHYPGGGCHIGGYRNV